LKASIVEDSQKARKNPGSQRIVGLLYSASAHCEHSRIPQDAQPLPMLLLSTKCCIPRLYERAAHTFRCCDWGFDYEPCVTMTKSGLGVAQRTSTGSVELHRGFSSPTAEQVSFSSTCVHGKHRVVVTSSSRSYGLLTLLV
jgi:hypothetical protein